MEYSIKDITTILNGIEVPFEDLNISLLLTDSRSLKSPAETLFFAIKSKSNDGHRFIEDLYKKGVRNFVTEQNLPIFATFKGANIIKTDNSVKAMQKIAATHRKKFKIPVIGITGSNGKTIVKEWLNQLLQPDFFITRSPRSYNSQIGVPLSVWGLEQRSTLAIFEAGISQPDEMEALSEIIAPTIGIFTCIGDAHQEGFKSTTEKLNEKLKLFKSSKTIIFNVSHKEIKENIQNRYPEKELIGWSDSDTSAPLYIKEISKDNNVATVTYIYKGNEEQFKIPFIEDGSIENAIHSLCTMLFCFGITPKEAATRLLNIEPVAMETPGFQGM